MIRARPGTAVLLLLGVLLLPALPQVEAQVCDQGDVLGSFVTADETFSIAAGDDILGFCLDENQSPSVQTLACSGTAGAGVLTPAVGDCANRCEEPGVFHHSTYNDYPKSATEHDSNDVVTVDCEAGWENTGGTTTADFECEGGAWVPALATFCDEDINECTRGTDNCPADSKCVNNPGSFDCICDYGFEPTADGEFDDACVAVLKCPDLRQIPHGSYPDHSTRLGGGQVTVTCDAGWGHIIPTTPSVDIVCVAVVGGSPRWEFVAGGVAVNICTDDIDECLTNPCPDLNAKCVNTLGSYTCQCDAGYQVVDNSQSLSTSYVCAAVNPLLNNCGLPPQYANAYYSEIELTQAVANGASITATCLPGYRTSSTNSAFSFSCTGSVSTGFNWSPATSLCADFDECTASPCGNNARCIDNIGSYSCVCEEGFARPAGSSINDDCVLRVSCGDPGTDQYATHETSTSFDVGTQIDYECLPGFAINGILGNNQYTKQCLPTGQWSNGQTCVDINECNTVAICGDPTEKHQCWNTPGSYKCWCYFGFYLNAVGNCVPVPAAEMNRYRCHEGCFHDDEPYYDRDRDHDHDDYPRGKHDYDKETTFIIAIVALVLTVVFFFITCILICCIFCFQTPGAQTVVAEPQAVVASNPYGCLPASHGYGGNQWYRKRWW